MREQEHAVERRRRTGVDKVTRVFHSIGTGIQGGPGASASSAETIQGFAEGCRCHKRSGEEVAAG